jgi:hypothetical protein
MTDQMPLYIGIPLALLCLSLTALVVILIVVTWRDR